jgi:hypothetical protein
MFFPEIFIVGFFHISFLLQLLDSSGLFEFSKLDDGVGFLLLVEPGLQNLNSHIFSLIHTRNFPIEFDRQLCTQILKRNLTLGRS